jgi:RNA polymerase sigma-70 factor (ECF subfamily)
VIEEPEQGGNRLAGVAPTADSFVTGPFPDRSRLVPVSPLMASRITGSAGGPVGCDEAWLREFHAGEHGCLERCYRDHLQTVDGAVAGVLTGADRETLVHEVFFRLLTETSLRQSFRGGSFASWLRVVARHQAIDYARRRRLEVSFTSDPGPSALVSMPQFEQQIDVRLTLERFRERILPPRWRAVFDARIVAQQDQPTAARKLGMRRTTLAYQEYRIRRLLRRFVLRGESR